MDIRRLLALASDKVERGDARLRRYAFEDIFLMPLEGILLMHLKAFFLFL